MIATQGWRVALAAAVVTGSTRNPDRGHAVALARNGADLVVHHHLPADRPGAEETARLVPAEGVRATLVSGDLCDVSVIRPIFDENVAGIRPRRSF
jgi:NAD(P)-dependent dehydrogenase (short-subunit alcohol dehydrogenase family)